MTLADSFDNNDPVRFDNYSLADGAPLASVMPEGSDHCGVYVLLFDDGTRYVGQSIDVASRVNQHQHGHQHPKWPAILSVRFCPAPRGSLNDLERRVIHDQQCRHVLRNQALTARAASGGSLTSWVGEEVQAAWLAGGTAEADPARRNLAQQRMHTRAHFDQLSGRPDFVELAQVTAQYVGNCIMQPARTERRFWTCTSMASTGSTDGWQRLIVINVGLIETLVIAEATRARKAAVSGFLNLDRSLEVDGWPGVTVEQGEYSPIGDIARIWFDDLASLRTALDHQEVITSGKKLTHDLMRQQPTIFGRFHDYNLADVLFTCTEPRTESLRGHPRRS